MRSFKIEGEARNKHGGDDRLEESTWGRLGIDVKIILKLILKEIGCEGIGSAQGQ
jgi:hypothetical protein